jgi:lysophospholipase L1-like esterase
MHRPRAATYALLAAIGTAAHGCATSPSPGPDGSQPGTLDAGPGLDGSRRPPFDASDMDSDGVVSVDDAEPIDVPILPTDGNDTLDGVLPAFDSDTDAHVRQIVARGMAMGNHHEVFAKIGDSITESASFLQDCGYGWYDTAGNAAALDAIQYFSAFPLGDRNSLNRASVCAVGGWSTDQALAGAPNAPVNAELAAIQPLWAIVMFGTNDLERFDLPTYLQNMNQLLDILEANGTVPILSTIPPRADTEPFISRAPMWVDAIRGLAQQRHLPLIDYNLALQPLPGYGLSDDGIHPSVFHDPDDKACYFISPGLTFGYNVRNFTALVMLDRLRNQY